MDIFKKKSISSLGIDIGTTGIRIVQLGIKNEKVYLENYASIETKDYLEILGSESKFNNIKISDKKISDDLRKVIQGAGIASKKVSMAVPISSAFTSTIDLPEMPDREIENAINYEAKQYIPIAIDEVIFDWTIIRRTETALNPSVPSSKKIKKIKILLVAIPKEITNKYINIASSLGLELSALETESFSLARSFAKNEKGSVLIVDIGNKTTSITSVVDETVISSHSLSGAGGEEITKVISHGINVNFHRAEQLKMGVGFDNKNGSEKQISQIIMPVMSIIISEIIKINETLKRSYKKDVSKIIITGRTAYIPGLIEYFTSKIRMPIEVGNPWKGIIYDEILSDKLKECSPYYSVAVGLALRGLREK